MSTDIRGTLPPAIEKKNGAIELLRFLCAISIVFTHMHYLSILPFGHRAVEIFFLLSGFLMMRSMDRRAAGTHSNGAGLMQETSSFIWGKVKRIYPELFISLVIAGIAFVALSHKSPALIVIDLVRMFAGDVCMLRSSGIVFYMDPMNGVTWYIFSMLMGLTFLYPLVRRYGVSLLLFVVCLCIMGYRLRTECTLGRYWDVVGVTLWGNVRAFADMGLGACAYPLAKRLAMLPLRRYCRFLCDAVRLACLCIVAYLIFKSGPARDGHGLFLVYSFILVVLTFSGQGLCSNLFNNKLAYFLGSFSLPLYLSHRSYTLYMKYYFPGRAEHIASILFCSVLTALCVMYGAKLWRKYITAENMKRWLLQPSERG